jgi:hypothetical protein
MTDPENRRRQVKKTLQQGGRPHMTRGACFGARATARKSHAALDRSISRNPAVGRHFLVSAKFKPNTIGSSPAMKKNRSAEKISGSVSASLFLRGSTFHPLREAD